MNLAQIVRDVLAEARDGRGGAFRPITSTEGVVLDHITFDGEHALIHVLHVLAHGIRVDGGERVVYRDIINHETNNQVVGECTLVRVIDSLWQVGGLGKILVAQEARRCRL